MYKLSVPVMYYTITDENRDLYMQQFRQAGVERVFLAFNRCLDEKKHPQMETDLRKDVAWLEENGIESGIWVGSTIGHGGPLAGEANTMDKDIPYTRLTRLNGEQISETYCPTDPRFVAAVEKMVQMAARTGVKTILLDDDYRLSQHGDLCCACPAHMARIRELCGGEISREELREKAFTGKPSIYRDAWLQAQGESMEDYARALRRAVDSVDPTIRLAMCAAHCVWDMDGTDPVRLTRILAGDTAPLLRLHGAPYWANEGGSTMPAVLETARMFVSFCKDTGIECFAEGDVYPRPRYRTPASYLQLFDAAMRADGQHDGLLKYMFNYYSGPEYDTGYLRFHNRGQKDMEKLSAMFAGGANCGVRVYTAPHLLQKADLDLHRAHDCWPEPYAGAMLTRCSIPTVYDGPGICGIVFGGAVQLVTPEILNQGLILDGSAAAALTEQGVDVGLERFDGYASCNVDIEAFPGQKERITVANGGCRVAAGALRPGAVVESTTVIGETEYVLSYRYENAAGQRFVVFLFEAGSVAGTSGLFHGYARQRQLYSGIRWLSGRELPVVCPGNPDLYILCREDKTGMDVALLNCFADEIVPVEVTLAGEYAKASWGIQPGVLEGHQVTLPGIPAFGFDFFRVEK